MYFSNYVYPLINIENNGIWARHALILLYWYLHFTELECISKASVLQKLEFIFQSKTRKLLLMKQVHPSLKYKYASFWHIWGYLNFWWRHCSQTWMSLELRHGDVVFFFFSRTPWLFGANKTKKVLPHRKVALLIYEILKYWVNVIGEVIFEHYGKFYNR